MDTVPGNRPAFELGAGARPFEGLRRIVESGHRSGAVYEIGGDDVAKESGLAGPGRSVDGEDPGILWGVQAALTASCWFRTSG